MMFYYSRFELVLMASVPGLTSRVFGFSKLDTEYRGTKTLKLKSGAMFTFYKGKKLFLNNKFFWRICSDSFFNEKLLRT